MRRFGRYAQQPFWGKRMDAQHCVTYRTMIKVTMVAVLYLQGCSALYRETRYINARPDQESEWIPIDSVDQFGYFHVACTLNGVTVEAAGQLHRDVYPETIGPPLMPIFSRAHPGSDSDLIVTRVKIVSPRDSCTIDLHEISLRVGRTSVSLHAQFLQSQFTVVDTTRELLPDFRGPVHQSDSLWLDLGVFRVGSTDVQWPVLLYTKHSDLT